MKEKAICLLFVCCFVKADIIGDVFDAVRKDDVGKMKSLLEKNRDDLGTFINTRDKNSGQTPLMMSILMGKVEIVRILLAEDVVDVTIPEKDGYTPYHGAGFQGRAEIAKLLLEDRRQIDPNLKHKDGFLWDMNNKKWSNGFYIQFKQSFAKETLSYDELLKS